MWPAGERLIEVVVEELSPGLSRHVKLRPFEAEHRDEALALLLRGFPETQREFWQRGLDRQAALQPGGFGYFLDVGPASVGLILTLRSHRHRIDAAPVPVINVSSWYVEPAYRWQAPVMLRTILAEPEAVVTDLTAAPHLYRMNAALGLRVWSTGMILAAAAPWAALPGSRDVQILRFRDAGPLLTDGERALLEWHERDGCIAAVLREADAVSPVLFRLIRRKGARFAQLIYAHSRKAVIRNLPSVMRFLASHGILFISIDAQHEDCPRGAWFRAGRLRFWQGPVDGDRLDYAYSELVLFGVS